MTSVSSSRSTFEQAFRVIYFGINK